MRFRRLSGLTNWKRQVSNLAWLLLIGAALPGCGGARTVQAKPKGTEAPTEGPGSCALPDVHESDEILEVALAVSAPFSDASIAVDADGQLSYALDVHPPVESGQEQKQKSATLSCEQLKDLRSLIVETKIFSLDEAAWQIQGEDCPSSSLYVKTPEGEKTFSCVCRCPEELYSIRARLQELLGEEIVEYGF